MTSLLAGRHENVARVMQGAIQEFLCMIRLGGTSNFQTSLGEHLPFHAEVGDL